MTDSNMLEARERALAAYKAKPDDRVKPSHAIKIPTTCSCGYPEGTFACKIRHVQLNTGDAKAAKD